MSAEDLLTNLDQYEGDRRTQIEHAVHMAKLRQSLAIQAIVDGEDLGPGTAYDREPRNPLPQTGAGGAELLLPE